MLRHAVSEEELNLLQDLYEASFPEAEKKPFAFMVKKREEGFFDLLMVEDGQGEFCGLAIMLLSGGFALLDYLAIVPRNQGGGLGSDTLARLREIYGSDRVVVEIESTVGAEAEAAQNRRERLRRKDFYLHNGMSPTGLLVNLMGVEMEVLTFGRELTFEEYYTIYDNVFPGGAGDKVRQAG